MSTVSRPLIVLCAAALIVSLCPVVALAGAVRGTGLCFPASDPDYTGYYQYCYHITWDTTEYGGQGLSHSAVYLALAACQCACDPGYFGHLIPAGVGVGIDECEVEFMSEFDCEGDPHFPMSGPTMKFEPVEGDCEPGTVGWMHVCYYSLFPPTEHGVFEDHLAIKFGTNVELGELEGVLPYCECDPSSEELSSWGVIKSLYR